MDVVRIVRSKRRRRTLTARRVGDGIEVRVPAGMDPDEEARQVAGLVEKLRRKEARRTSHLTDELLTERAHELWRRYLSDHAMPDDIRVRWVSNQDKRWGSCSPSSRSIRLSDRLQAMPAWVIDRVLMHELVHLIVVNHGEQFRDLNGRFPDAGRADAYLQGWSDAMRTLG